MCHVYIYAFVRLNKNTVSTETPVCTEFLFYCSHAHTEGFNWFSMDTVHYVLQANSVGLIVYKRCFA